jgi:hypothetical protein
MRWGRQQQAARSNNLLNHGGYILKLAFDCVNRLEDA